MSNRNKKKGPKTRDRAGNVKKETSNNVIHAEKGKAANHTARTVSKEKSTTAARIVRDNWACCVYMIFTITLTSFLFTQVKKLIVQYMAKQKTGDLFATNNDYTKSFVLEPFAGSVSLVLNIIISGIFLWVFIKIIKKFGYKINNAAKWLLLVEVITIILAAIAVIYYSSNYQIMNLGIDASRVRSGSSQYAPIIEISNGYGMVYSKDESLIHTILRAVASFNMRFVKNIDLYIAIDGSIFIPLKVYDSMNEKH